MKPYQCHLIACNGKDCKRAGGGKKLLKAAKKLLGKDARYTKGSHVKCLGACKQGPVLIVYPDGVWYRCDGTGALTDIVKTHLKDGQIARQHVLLDMNKTSR